MEQKRVAIIFYGLTKTLSRTIDSIRNNLFKPLDDNSIEYDIFIHTYKIHGPYRNCWSGESVNNYPNENIEKLLNPKHFIWDNQETIANSINFYDYYAVLGNWTGMSPTLTKYLIKNLCLALYSKKKITTLFEKYKDDYDYAIIIRPDLLLKSKIDIEFFNELTNSNIIIPEAESYSGCNDRFCIGKVDIVLYYGKLFDDLKTYSQKTSIISEKYLLDKLNEKEINIIKKKIDYDTIRIS